MKYYSINYTYPEDFDLCLELNRMYSGNGMKPTTGDVILMTTKLDDGSAMGCVGTVVGDLERGSAEELIRPEGWCLEIPEGWAFSQCWRIDWTCEPKPVSNDFDCVQGGKMTIDDRNRILSEILGESVATIVNNQKRAKRAAVAVKSANPQLDLKRYVKRVKGVDLSNATQRMLFDDKHGAKEVLKAITTLTGVEFVELFWV